MNLHNASLYISAVSPKQYPPTTVCEIALAGRSNVGKSSFLNKLLNRKNLARTSSTPGKTATLNFYDIDNKLFIVDLPGYGYAKVSQKEKERWAKMINTYLATRKQLAATFLLVDARHKPTKDDLDMYAWIKNRHGRAVVILTKCDKIKKSKLDEHIEEAVLSLGLDENDLFVPFSSETGLGRDEVLEIIREIANIE